MTWPLETIVCGVDDSAASRAAACAAIGLAGAIGARLVVAHVAPIADAAARGDALLDELLRDAGGVEAEGLPIAVGEPARRLAMEAERIGGGLIVVGRQGPGEARDGILGSVAGRLAADAPCPVVVTPPGGVPLAQMVQWRHGPVVCGFDGSDTADRGAAVAAVLAARLGVALSLVQVVDSLVEDPPAAMPTDDELSATAHRAWHRDGLDGTGGDLRIARALRHGDICEQLERVAAVATAPAIVIGARGREPWRAAMLGSVARQMTERARRAVVVVPPGMVPVRPEP